MKLHWGYKIGLAYILFVIAMLALVCAAMQQKFDLVAADYYEQGIRHQNRIEQIFNAEQANDKLYIEYDEVSQSILITKKSVLDNKSFAGKIYFYKPSDAAQDFSVPLNLEENGVQRIKRASMISGMWRVKVSWELTGKQFFQEKKIYIR